MDFFEMLQDDIDHTFFDEDIFCEKKKYNNLEIRVVEDDDSMMRKYSGEFEALQSGSHMILVPDKEFENSRQPKANDAVRYDGGIYTVDEVKKEKGVYLIFLNRGRT